MKLLWPARIFVPLLLLSLAACGDNGDTERENAAAEVAPDAPPTAAELEADAALADEAAADEAADIEAFGGNAAALPANGR